MSAFDPNLPPRNHTLASCPFASELNEKYLSGGLGPEDRQPLLEHVKAERDPLKLAGLLILSAVGRKGG
jgi:hypothetical protein